MLILLDNLILGSVREKLVIAYYRYKGGQSAITYINEVCRLCKDTGYLPAAFTDGVTPRRPQYYPEEYFARFEVPGRC
jgi:WASH complex subunit strumpellin